MLITIMAAVRMVYTTEQPLILSTIDITSKGKFQNLNSFFSQSVNHISPKHEVIVRAAFLIQIYIMAL